MYLTHFSFSSYDVFYNLFFTGGNVTVTQDKTRRGFILLKPIVQKNWEIESVFVPWVISNGFRQDDAQYACHSSIHQPPLFYAPHQKDVSISFPYRLHISARPLNHPSLTTATTPFHIVDKALRLYWNSINDCFHSGFVSSFPLGRIEERYTFIYIALCDVVPSIASSKS